MLQRYYSVVGFVCLLLVSCRQPQIVTADSALQYETMYASATGDTLYMRCLRLPQVVPFPLADAVETIDQHYNTSARGHRYWKSDLVDSMYAHRAPGIMVFVARQAEVGTQYEYMLRAGVRPEVRLLNGIAIGGPASQLDRYLPEDTTAEEQSDIAIDDFRWIIFEDHWSYYSHTYSLAEGQITQLQVDYQKS